MPPPGRRHPCVRAEAPSRSPYRGRARERTRTLAVDDAQDVEVSEAQIAAHWREEGYYEPPAKFIGQANGNDPAIFDRFGEENFPECFKEYAELLTWDK